MRGYLKRGLGAVLLLTLAVGGVQSADENWSDQFAFSGFDDAVYDATIYNGDLIVSGHFLNVDGVPAYRLARFDGSAWHGMIEDEGNNAHIRALAVYDGDLYVGGSFEILGGVATSNLSKWDGTSWTAVEPGFDNFVYAMAVYDEKLYVGGSFTGYSGVPVRMLAAWDGAVWESAGIPADPLYGSAPSNAQIMRLTVHDGELYAAGAFHSDLGESVLKFDGTTWSGVGEIFSHSDHDNIYMWGMGEYDGDLILSGTFTHSGATPMERIAAWDGVSWSPLGSGITGACAWAIQEYNGDMYATGGFAEIGGQAVDDLARWDGTSWSVVDPTFSNTEGGRMLQLYDGLLLVGGYKQQVAGEQMVDRLFAWDGSSFSSMMTSDGQGLDDWVHAVCEYDGDVLAAGDFIQAGSLYGHRVVAWDGTSWNGFPQDPPEGTIIKFFEYEGTLLAGGHSFAPDGFDANQLVVQWDGSSWSAMGAGLDNTMSIADVRDFAVYQGDLYCAGASMADNGSLIGLAIWDGSTWSSLSGSGNFEGLITDLAVHDGKLIVAGSFDYIDGIACNNIAAWDGSTWQSLNTGFQGRVNDLEIYDGRLHACGWFYDTGDDVRVYRIAAWDGVEWQALGSGLDDEAMDMAVYDDKLIVAGDFERAGSANVSSLAVWDGVCWGSIGSGVYWQVEDVEVASGALWCTGWVYEAGGQPSSYIASYRGSIEACDCCEGIRGNIDGDVAGTSDIADLVFLVDHMFNEGPEPPCPSEADINGDGVGPDIADVIHLVSWMFQQGPAPADCE